MTDFGMLAAGTLLGIVIGALIATMIHSHPATDTWICGECREGFDDPDDAVLHLEATHGIPDGWTPRGGHG